MKLLFVLLLVSCTPFSETVPDGATADAATALSKRVQEDGGAAAPGILPLGYNQRQCQWDGCEPPPERVVAVSSDPVP